MSEFIFEKLFDGNIYLDRNDLRIFIGIFVIVEFLKLKKIL